ncbi:MAG: DUF305 domain-containing protein [Rhodospirillales bacterium]
MKRAIMTLSASLVLGWIGAAAAQTVDKPTVDKQSMDNMPGMKPVAPTPPTAPTAAPPAGAKIPGAAYVPANDATPAYKQAMDKMMGGMDAPYTGDPDHDFVTHMEPHHQGAIDMAEIELKYGSDPKLKQLAGRIIAAQQHEIGFMQTWLEKHPHPKQAGHDVPPNVQWK